MTASDSPPATSGRFAYEGLERAMHEKARLGIMTSLVTHPEGLLFTDLKELCSLTDGNLNRHLKVLHDEGLIQIRKASGRNRPQTVCRITASGRERFLQYVAELERVIADAAVAAGARSRSGKELAKRSLLGGLSPA
jgi:DNA-binding MarR family transcriptional regulator